MTRTKIATYPLALYVPPIHHKGLLPSEVAELTYQAHGRFISACNEALFVLDLTMDEGGAVWGADVSPEVRKKHRDIVEETADGLDYEDIFDVATEWRARNESC